MPNHEQLIRARVAILTMAAELKNVARACKLAGVSRSQFYAMKRAFMVYGRDGLAPRPRRKPQMPNRTPAALEAQILAQTLATPTVSYIRLAEKMNADGIVVTSTMIRYVWQRNGLSTRSARFQWVKRQNGRPGGAKGKRAEESQNVDGPPCVSLNLVSAPSQRRRGRIVDGSAGLFDDL
jgi:hypothetical protein